MGIVAKNSKKPLELGLDIGAVGASKYMFYATKSRSRCHFNHISENLVLRRGNFACETEKYFNGGLLQVFVEPSKFLFRHGDNRCFSLLTSLIKVFIDLQFLSVALTAVSS